MVKKSELHRISFYIHRRASLMKFLMTSESSSPMTVSWRKEPQGKFLPLYLEKFLNHASFFCFQCFCPIQQGPIDSSSHWRGTILLLDHWLQWSRRWSLRWPTHQTILQIRSSSQGSLWFAGNFYTTVIWRNFLVNIKTRIFAALATYARPGKHKSHYRGWSHSLHLEPLQAWYLFGIFSEEWGWQSYCRLHWRPPISAKEFMVSFVLNSMKSEITL